VLTSIAAEIDPEDVRDDLLDLDSMNWLNFLIGIHNRFGVDIPESDYASLRTLADVVGYVERRICKARTTVTAQGTYDPARCTPSRDSVEPGLRSVQCRRIPPNTESLSPSTDRQSRTPPWRGPVAKLCYASFPSR
jgi:acyl carrier protein